jgi:pimeloyl-ACP methyl ester carboxylesterase
MPCQPGAAAGPVLRFPRECPVCPTSRADHGVPDADIADLTNIRRWSIMPKGGHFAALEQPQLLADEVPVFFRELR